MKSPSTVNFAILVIGCNDPDDDIRGGSAEFM